MAVKASSVSSNGKIKVCTDAGSIPKDCSIWGQWARHPWEISEKLPFS